MRIITLLFVAVFISALSSAQCVVDTSVTHNVSGVYPDSATGIPHAYVGVPYSTTIQFVVPTDTVYLSLPAHIDYVQVTSISNLPAGFTFPCNPLNCTFPGGTSGCMSLESSGPTAGQVGSYPLVVNTVVHGTVASIPTTLPQTNDNYIIVIENNTATISPAPVVFSVSQNVPNPFGSSTEIKISSPRTQKVWFRVFNLIGLPVYSTTLDVAKGITPYVFSPDGLDPGIYIYTMSDGKSSVTRRMVISNDK